MIYFVDVFHKMITHALQSNKFSTKTKSAENLIWTNWFFFFYLTFTQNGIKVSMRSPLGHWTKFHLTITRKKPHKSVTLMRKLTFTFNPKLMAMGSAKMHVLLQSRDIKGIYLDTPELYRPVKWGRKKIWGEIYLSWNFMAVYPGDRTLVTFKHLTDTSLTVNR